MNVVSIVPGVPNGEEQNLLLRLNGTGRARCYRACIDTAAWRSGSRATSLLLFVPHTPVRRFGGVQGRRESDMSSAKEWVWSCVFLGRRVANGGCALSMPHPRKMLGDSSCLRRRGGPACERQAVSGFLVPCWALQGPQSAGT
jgi:hypothetical protein